MQTRLLWFSSVFPYILQYYFKLGCDGSIHILPSLLTILPFSTAQFDLLDIAIKQSTNANDSLWTKGV
jgi:hypothetical protein